MVVDINEGKMVPVDITVNWLLNTIGKSKVKNFLPTASREQLIIRGLIPTTVANSLSISEHFSCLPAEIDFVDRGGCEWSGKKLALNSASSSSLSICLRLSLSLSLSHSVRKGQ